VRYKTYVNKGTPGSKKTWVGLYCHLNSHSNRGALGMVVERWESLRLKSYDASAADLIGGAYPELMRAGRGL